jgi:hypothetical protein
VADLARAIAQRRSSLSLDNSDEEGDEGNDADEDGGEWEDEPTAAAPPRAAARATRQLQAVQADQLVVHWEQQNDVMNPCSQTVNEGEVGLTNLVYNDDGSASIDVVLPAMTRFNRMHFDINNYDKDGTKPAVQWEPLGGISFNEPAIMITSENDYISATNQFGIAQGDWTGGPALRLTFGDQAAGRTPDEFIKAIFSSAHQSRIMAGHQDYGEQYIQSMDDDGWQSLVLLEYMSSSCAGYIEVPNDVYLDASFFFAATLIPAASGQQEFYCLEGDGGPCYNASTSCFPSCPNMGAWNDGNGYVNTYESFRAYCSTWSANSGKFYGGAGSCTGPTTDLDYGEQYTSPYGGTILGRHGSGEPSGWTLNLTNTQLKLTVYSSDGNDKVIDWTPTLTEETVVALHVYTPPVQYSYADPYWQTPESEIELWVDGTSAQGYYSLEDGTDACIGDYDQTDTHLLLVNCDDQNHPKTLLECAVECSQHQDCGGFGYGSGQETCGQETLANGLAKCNLYRTKFCGVNPTWHFHAMGTPSMSWSDTAGVMPHPGSIMLGAHSDSTGNPTGQFQGTIKNARLQNMPPMPPAGSGSTARALRCGPPPPHRATSCDAAWRRRRGATSGR